MVKSKRACYSLLLSLPFLAAIVLAQESPAPPAPAQQAPELAPRPSYTPAPVPAAVDGRIHLDVVVTDKAGKPIPGLELQDFTLKDNNLPTKILSFHAIPGNVPSPVQPSEVIVLLDMVNEGFQTVARSRDEVSRFLRQNGGHLAQPVSVFLFTNDGVKILLQPSLDGNALAAQLDKAEPGLRTLGRSAGVNGAIERFDLSIQWFTAVARNEAKRPGKKLLIWAGAGWPLLDRPNIATSSKGEQQLFSGIVNLSTALREAHVAVYSVTLGQPNPTTFLYQDFLKGIKTAEKANASDLNLKVLAVQSGGRVLSPDNDLASQIATCVQDASAFYTISFDPPKADRANEYHDLKVEIDKPGLTARTNTGYYNQP